MKKMRQLFTLLFLLAAAPIVFAQASSDCTIKYNLFKGDYNAKNYDKAYENWMWCMDNCPTLSVNIYKYGIKIAENKLENATEADKKAAADLVMRVYNQRLEHFPKDKADIYDNIASFKGEQGASEEEVYGWLNKTFKEDPTALSPKNIYKYFDIILNKYKDTDTQKVFDTYDEVGEALELKRKDYTKRIDVINAKDSTKLSKKDLKRRKNSQQIITNLSIVESGLDQKLAAISTCERLIPFNRKNFDANKENAIWLKRAVSRMYNKECTEDPLYDQLVEAYVKADPSPNASVFYASILMKNGETNKAMEYFKNAVDQEADTYKKAGYLYKIADILRKKGRKSEARSYCYQALENQPTMGRAYLLIASMYASSANSCGTDIVSKRMVYVAALNKARKAKSVDPSISSIANRFINSYADNIPTTKDLFVAGVKSGTAHKIGCWINETVRVP
ncbi:tetratricopeptide repeat protein [Lutibacter flavus]|uniref:Tetratricopeptide repeat-containing protein n=1 Tax=Lutibacter flavus TaxID=691689 RepID=A0A238Z1T5_9FLAO|nr:tetratricopeptide repeat protein [Lutibacter flavus]SNR76803.1 Tetratricopeptide repeat-containing protein [Lutibacter flavus]